MSGTRKEDDSKEKESSLANLGCLMKGKQYFHCGFTEHMKYQCPKTKADNGVKCKYPDYS